jgi:uncharacterized paraquat-inducible protein A
MNINAQSSPCGICGFPITAPAVEGQTAKCPYCGTINKAIQDITIPTSFIVGVITFTLGVFLGPVLLSAMPELARKLSSATKRGQEYLSEQTRKRL